jgi:hypothetical protein
MKNPPAVIRILYAVCLAAATWNHARIVFEHGVAWDYGGVPPFVAAFWTSLTFFDALAVVLLLARPRAGVALAALIIVCDVMVNAYVGLAYGFDVASFAVQCLFLVFVLGTVRTAWPRTPQLNAAPAGRP